MDRGTTGLRLRVSDDNRMAIEDSDLSRRQPKIFYATSDIIRASNRALKNVGSYFQLIQGGERVKILTGWWSAETLYSVYLRYNAPIQKNKRKWKKATSSSAYQHIRPPQNCNAIAAEVIGGSSAFLGTNTLSHAIRKAGLLAPTEEGDRQRVFRDSRYSSEQYFQYEDRAIRAYLDNSDGDDAERHGLNRFAAPEVGEGFVVATLGRAIRQQNSRGVYRDFDTDTERELNWSYHFGGVVARSGNDRVTLENYARGDGRADSPDPRWYFQMYGTGTGQSYYEAYRRTDDYANPIVFTVKK